MAKAKVMPQSNSMAMQPKSRILERFGREAEHHKRLARDIHDSVANHVVSANLMLGEMRCRALDEDSKRAIDELTGELAHALRDLRSFCFLLDAPLLSEAEWRESLETFVRGFSLRAGLTLHFDLATGTTAIDRSLQAVTLRIVQEALMNVARHAKAQSVSVSLIVDAGELRLDIADDGQGFPPRASPGVGLGSMTARSREVGGDCRIRSSWRGTSVSARLPLVN